jgi:AAHS family 4-hydroxybenzoate transporter-like MFS transporter
MFVKDSTSPPTHNVINIQRFMDANGISPYQCLVFALCFSVVLLDGFDTAAIGYIAPSLSAEWAVARPALAPVLSAALFGLAAGALSAGPLADRLGRKTMLVGSVLVMGTACLLSSSSGSLEQLVIWRFVTGVGLGAAMPNAVTLTSEFCPRSHRAVLTNAMFCGFPLGAAFGGFLAAWMIPIWGWRSVLMLGGVVPLAIVVLLFVLLPESVRYMVARHYPAERIRRVLMQVSRSAAHATQFILTETAPAPGEHAGLGLVLSRPYLIGSTMLWLAYFMGLVIFYALINWMPTLFRDAGLSPATAALVSALFPLGGVGAVLCGWLMDRFNANTVVATGFALTSVAIFAIGQAYGHLGLLMAAVLLGGTLMNTAQSSLPALAAAFYPTSGRATGVAWMLGLGRFGGIAGSFLVAELTRQQLGFGQIFLVVAVPGLIAAGALLVKRAAQPHWLPEERPAGEAMLGH